MTPQQMAARIAAGCDGLKGFDRDQMELARRIRREVKAAVKAERERWTEIVQSEPELPGRMPDGLWKRCCKNRVEMERALRTVVQETKANIIERATKPAKRKGW